MTANFYGVRRATPDDIDALYSFVPMVLQETSVLPLSGVKVEQMIERCCHNQGGAIAGIIDGEEGTISASIGMAFTESELSDDPYIFTGWFGIHPALRGDPHKNHYGRRLFDFARWCHTALEQANGAPILMRFDLMTTEDLAGKMRLYQRNLTQIGASYALGAAGTFKPQLAEEKVAA